MDYSEKVAITGRQITEGKGIINAADILLRNQLYSNIEMAVNRERNYAALTNNMFTYATKASVGTAETLLRDTAEATVIMTTATVLTLISTDANDTAAGSGARSVTLIGLNAAKEQFIETVPLNGTTEVVSTAQFYRINRAIVFSAGGVSAPTGTIYIGTGAIVGGKPSTIYGIIMPGVGMMRQLRISTPIDYEVLISQILTTVGNGKDVKFKLKGKFDNSPWIEFGVFDNYQSITDFSLLIPQRLGQQLDIEVTVAADVAGAPGTMYIVLALIHKDILAQTFSTGIDLDTETITSWKPHISGAIEWKG